MKCNLKMSFAKYRPFDSGITVLSSSTDFRSSRDTHKQHILLRVFVIANKPFPKHMLNILSLNLDTTQKISRSGSWYLVNTLRPRQNGRHLPDDIFICIFLNENIWVFTKISLKFVPKGLTSNIPALAQIMAWRRPGDKPSSEPMMVSALTHICVTRPQWVNIPFFVKT